MGWVCVGVGWVGLECRLSGVQKWIAARVVAGIGRAGLSRPLRRRTRHVPVGRAAALRATTLPQFHTLNISRGQPVSTATGELRGLSGKHRSRLSRTMTQARQSQQRSDKWESHNVFWFWVRTRCCASVKFSVSEKLFLCRRQDRHPLVRHPPQHETQRPDNQQQPVRVKEGNHP